MAKTSVEELRQWLGTRLVKYGDDEYAASLRKSNPGLMTVIGAKIQDLRKLAVEASQALELEPIIWARFISAVINDGLREESLFGAVGLSKVANELDDLFGERAGGWGRALTNKEQADAIGEPVGNWVLEDLSRVGYLEAWAVNGENLFKKRMAVIATIQLNWGESSYPKETFRVLRHLMVSEETIILEALSLAIREIQDYEEVERFFAWWAPRCKRSLVEEATGKMPEENRNRILALITE